MVFTPIDSVSEKLDFTSISKEMSTLFTPRELTGMMVSRGRLNEVVKFLISVVGLPSLSVVGVSTPRSSDISIITGA